MTDEPSMPETDPALADPGVAALTQHRAAPEPEVLLSWDADEYIHYEKGTTWYIVAGIVTVAMIVYSLITEAYTTAVVVSILAGVVYLYAHEEPTVHRIVVNRLGIGVGEKFYPFSSITSFWLIIAPGVQQLNIETTGRFGQTVTIQLGDMDPVLVRRTLANEIPEAPGKEESFLDRLARALKL